MKKTSRLAGAILAAALASVAGASETVTTNTYDPTSTSSDIDVSCKNLEFNQGGDIYGDCNYADGDEVGTRPGVLAREEGIACVWTGGIEGKWKLIFTTDGDDDDVELLNGHVVVRADGQKYRFRGRCASPASGTNVRIDLSGGAENNDGYLVWKTD